MTDCDSYRLFWTDVKFLMIQMLVWLNKSKINKDLWNFLKYVLAVFCIVSVAQTKDRFHTLFRWCFIDEYKWLCSVHKNVTWIKNTLLCIFGLSLHFQFITFSCNKHNGNDLYFDCIWQLLISKLSFNQPFHLYSLHDISNNFLLFTA